ncbi:EMB2076 [Symbiodinium natans]|uniref:EMB2076 protein n=1 Tax=Symbiodinium natans TaxID=878477 RepID=A0A812T829_9DINO|nr:EMB2076 [Symbiodinium natans]
MDGRLLYARALRGYSAVTPNVVALTREIQGACKATGRGWQHGLRLLLSELERSEALVGRRCLDIRALSAGLAACAAGARWQESLGILRYAEATGLGLPNAVGRSAAIATLLRAERWHQALYLFDKFEAELESTEPVSIGAAINACGQGSHWQGALFLLDRVVLHALKKDDPDGRVPRRTLQVCRNAAITACGRASRWGWALHMFFEHLALCGADEVGCSAVVNACQQASQWQQALGVLPFAPKGRRGEAAVTAAMAACERASCWPVALSLLSRGGGLESWNTAISACEKGGLWQAALALFWQLPARQLSPSGVSYNTAISACERESLWQDALFLLSHRRAVAEADVIAVGSTVLACAKAAQWEQCMAMVLNAWDIAGVSCDLVDSQSSSAVLLACQKASKWLQAWQVIFWQGQTQANVFTRPPLGLEADDLAFVASACDRAQHAGPALRMRHELNQSRLLRTSASSLGAAIVKLGDGTCSELLRGRVVQAAVGRALRTLQGGSGSDEVPQLTTFMPALCTLPGFGVHGTRESLVLLHSVSRL